MKRKQSGFTLIEIAIVLVIIGLLLGGVLKGQELINSAKVKNLASDFRSAPLFIYGYQDKFRALPGDDPQVTTHLAAATAATTPAGGVGNGAIGGTWDSLTITDETVLMWQHLRLAGLATGSTTAPSGTLTDQDTYLPQNAVGGRIGVESGNALPPITGLGGVYFVCSKGILGKFAKQLDVTLDDGHGDTGSLRVTANNTSSTPATRTAPSGTPPSGGAPAAVATPVDETLYTVCMGI
jgi:prepilin-type N-terminal cleavage/methylation domain-containing protein